MKNKNSSNDIPRNKLSPLEPLNRREEILIESFQSDWTSEEMERMIRVFEINYGSDGMYQSVFAVARSVLRDRLDGALKQIKELEG